MKYYLFLLKFLTPVHFGNSALGGMLEKVELAYGADELFSAIVTEAANLGEDVQPLIQYFSKQDIVLSSLFPYWQEQGKEVELYLVKPFYRGIPAEHLNLSYSETKKIATKLKKLKKGGHILIREMDKLLTALNNPQRKLDEEYTIHHFATETTTTRVNLRREISLPYSVGSYLFADKAGLYFVLGVKDENQLGKIKKIVESLGLTGIGGKRSSGWGKFVLANAPVELAKAGKDGKRLNQMLHCENDGLYMNIAPVCPENVEDINDDASFKIKKCSGFVLQNMDGNMVKRDSVYMLQDGSCFDKPIKGKMVEFHVRGVSHEIYRYGLGMLIGLGVNR